MINNPDEVIEIAKSNTGIIIPCNKLHSAPLGKWISCSTTDKPKSTAGRFKVESYCIHFKNWQTDTQYTYFFNKLQNKKLTLAERKQLQQQINQKIADDKAKQEQEKIKNVNYYRSKFLQFKPCIRHKYADRKGLQNLHHYNFKIDNFDRLVIPFFNTNGIMTGYQTIMPYKVPNNPDKRIFGSYNGCYWQFPHVNIDPGIYNSTNSFYLLGEGIATVLSAYEAIHQYWEKQIFCCYALCGFSANNLSNVIQATSHYNLPYYLLVDNDADKRFNTGFRNAKQLILDNPSVAIYPIAFGGNKSIDANDYILVNGYSNFCRLLSKQTNINQLIAKG